MGGPNAAASWAAWVSGRKGERSVANLVEHRACLAG